MTLAGISTAQFAALFGGGAALIVLIYLLRLRRRGKLISSDLIWRRVLLRQRTLLSELLSMLLQILVLLLICLALLDPRSEVSAGEQRILVLGVDASLSMAATGPGGTRLDLAKRQARELIDSLGPADEALLLALGPRINALTGFTSSRAELHAALDDLEPRGVDGDPADALAYAADAFAFRAPDPDVRQGVIIISDRPAPAELGPDASWITVGGSAPNLAITAFDVRQTFNQAPGNEVFVRVQNLSEGSASATLNVYTPDKLVGREKLDLGPGREFHKSYFLPIEISGRLAANLSDVKLEAGPDALALDDAAFAVLPGVRPVKVLLVSAENRFLSSALSINPLVRLTSARPAEYSAARAAANDVVILDRVAPGQVPAHAVYIYPPDGGPFAGAAVVERPALTSWEGEHPLLRFVTLSDLEIGKARPLKARAGDESLIDTFDGSLLLVRREGAYNRVGLGFDLTQSDLPLRVAFPVFVHNLVWWLGGQEASRLPSRTPLGERAQMIVPADINELELSGPGRISVVAAGQGGRLSFLPELPGFYAYQIDGTQQWVAASLINAAESDLRIASVEAAAAEPDRSPAQQPKQRVFWPILALAAFALALIDWMLLHAGKLA